VGLWFYDWRLVILVPFSIVSARLLKPIKEVISEYKVKYLLTCNGCLPENFLEELPDSYMFKFGVYHLYIFKENSN
jgi:hypothetical protein